MQNCSVQECYCDQLCHWYGDCCDNITATCASGDVCVCVCLVLGIIFFIPPPLPSTPPSPLPLPPLYPSLPSTSPSHPLHPSPPPFPSTLPLHPSTSPLPSPTLLLVNNTVVIGNGTRAEILNTVLVVMNDQDKVCEEGAVQEVPPLPSPPLPSPPLPSPPLPSPPLPSPPLPSPPLPSPPLPSPPLPSPPLPSPPLPSPPLPSPPLPSLPPPPKPCNSCTSSGIEKASDVQEHYRSSYQRLLRAVPMYIIFQWVSDPIGQRRSIDYRGTKCSTGG